MAIIKKTTTLNVGECVKQLESSYIVGRNVKWCDHFRKKICLFLLRDKNSTQQFSPRHLFQKYKNTHPQKRLVQNIHRNFIHDSQKLETHQMSINKWINKRWYIHTIEFYSSIGREKTTDTCNNR